MFKKSSTAVLLTLALALAGAWAQQQTGQAATGNVLELAPGAPDSYTVQKGDTLWDIATKFLKEPWRWPQIWRLNKEQIRNPHLIYPGDVVRLDRAGPSLAIAPGPAARAATAPGAPPDVRPRIRSEQLAAEAIPTIPLKVIEPFLTQPLVIERDGLDAAPRIVATQEGRYNVGAGSRAYVAGFGETKEPLWQVYRRGTALVDPDTDQTLGFEAIYLGSARLTRVGNPATVQIVSSTQEITTGDRLVIAPQPQIFAFAPRAPTQQIRGRIVGIYNGITDARSDYYQRGATGYYGYRQTLQRLGAETGNLAVVSINRGAKDGLEPGHVLAISRSTTIYNDRSTGPFYMGGPRTQPFPLPEERYGLMMVFRVFEHLAYALTLGVERPVAAGDFVTTP